ncbi:hypothetical protein JCM5353_004070 [Sporobolomyces roseus]
MSSTPASPSFSSSSGLDTARLLVQKVSRLFYSSKSSILIDQLVTKEAFRDEELGKRLGMPSRDVSKIAHRLVQDQLVQVHRRSELKPGAPKASLRTYFYLDFSKSVDVIKWRMWKVQQTIDVKLRNELDAQGYVCPLCKAHYTPLDAANLYDPTRNLLACSICQTEVTNNENEEQVKGNKDRMQRLNRQTKGIVDLLKKLERVELPRFDIERYLAIHGPALGATAAAAAAASGQTINLAPSVKVHLAGDDDEAIEMAKREQELLDKRAQNLLPSWISQSTIEKNGLTEEEEEGRTRERGEGEDEQGIVGSVEKLGEDGRGGGGKDGNGGLGSVDLGGFGAAMGFYEEQKPEEPIEDQGGDDLDAYYASLEASNPGQEIGSSTLNSPVIFFETPFDSPAVGSGASGTDGGILEDEEEIERAITGGSGKRSREESAGGNEEDNKRFKETEASPAAVSNETSPIVGAREDEEEEEEEEEFDEVDGEGENNDPNQLISVNGKMMPYSDVTEDMTSEMTADEYSAYWDVYARLND